MRNPPNLSLSRRKQAESHARDIDAVEDGRHSHERDGDDRDGNGEDDNR